MRIFYPSSLFTTRTIVKFTNAVLVVLFLLAGFSLQAKNYYFSSSSGNDSYSSTQAQSQITPWKTLSKLNSFFSSLVPGDNIYFKRGDIFYGTIVATKSGSSGNPITFASYGTGNKPVISGLSTVSSWSSLGNNIYQANVSGVSTALNLVAINGVPRQIGRYPNNSTTSDPYLYYETFASNGTSITDNELNSSTNWTGAEVVIKKRRWIMDRCKITSQSGGTITYTNPDTYPGTAGFGYFIQNDPRTLDQFGEWYLNTSTKNLQVHFGGGQPSSYAVQVSTIDNVINLGNTKYMSVQDLAVEGGNVAGIVAQNGSDITIQRCDLTSMGKDGVYILNSPNTLIESVTVTNALNNGVYVGSQYVANTVVRSCTIKNCGVIPGMGASGDGSYRGLGVSVSTGATIEYNNIDSIGYNAMDFQGSNVIIRYNFLNNFCNVKDDGGGIYSWANNTSSYTNRQIYNNIILNAKGDANGTQGKSAEAKGIYLDGGSLNVDIHDNSMANMARTGLLFNNAENIKINGNTVYNARFGIELVRLTEAALIRNIEMKRNVIYPKEVNQSAFYYKNMYLSLPTLLPIQQDMQSIGVVDSNYYATPNSIGFGYFYCLNYTTSTLIVTPPPLSLEAWKLFMNKDLNSKRAALSPATTANLRFEYNATTSAKTVALDAKYVGVDGAVYDGAITLQPYTSQVLVKNGAASTPAQTTDLKAVAAVPDISCFGGSTTLTVTGSGGTAPYTGTGSKTVSAGKASLKISVPSPVVNDYTSLYSDIGAVSSSKTYVLRFSTLGTTGNGSLKASLRQTGSPYTVITTKQIKAFGTGRVDHQFTFVAPTTTAATSFYIELLQTSGTTYVDNIAFFEANAAGDLISDNLYTSGQFEDGISDIYTWSSTNNHVATQDLTSKISNTYYYPVKDATGAIVTATAATVQPSLALTASSTAGTVAVSGGTTTVTISATGGTTPYTGTGNFDNVKVGTYNYTVTDARGCSAVTTINVTQAATSPTGLVASATAPAISCFGGNTTVSVSGSGGTAPYTGTGSHSINAGSGTLRISVASPVAGATTFLYSDIGAVSSSKTYVLRFSTLGTTGNGSLKLGIRQTNSPYNYIVPAQTATFGTSRVNHEFIFTAPTTTAAASFIIEVGQSSGTTYFDNIAFFEATSTGELTSDNLYSGGQFEETIGNIYTWSATNNHVAALDLSSKITNTYYYPVKDAKGGISIASVATVQPASALRAASTAGIITIAGGTTTVQVTATGGTPPYKGTGNFSNIQAGSYNYTVTDALGCSSVTTISVITQIAGSALKAVATVPAIKCFGSNATAVVTGSGGTQPYDGTGSYAINAGQGSLRISIANPVAATKTLVYSNIGEVDKSSTYILRFSTVGTISNGTLSAAIRQTQFPYANITPGQDQPYGTGRVDHEFKFTMTVSEASASFIIGIYQAAGTIYIDNIAFFEATSDGALITDNLFSSGQFEDGIADVYTWSQTNNHVASWDVSSKITNTYYFPVQDATGAINTATVLTSQPATPLKASATGGNIPILGGLINILVSATGGTPPYTGTGTFLNAKIGLLSFTVTDANGCSSVATTTITQNILGARTANPVTDAARSTTASADSTAAIPLSVTGLQDNPLTISSYPSPATREFNLMVAGGTKETVNIVVLSIDGKMLYQTRGASNSKYVFGSGFAPGMYVVKVIQGSNMQVQRIVKGKQ